MLGPINRKFGIQVGISICLAGLICILPKSLYLSLNNRSFHRSADVDAMLLKEMKSQGMLNGAEQVEIRTFARTKIGSLLLPSPDATYSTSFEVRGVGQLGSVDDRRLRAKATATIEILWGLSRVRITEIHYE